MEDELRLPATEAGRRGSFGSFAGTDDRLTLVQTHKIPHFPVLFFAGGFWRGTQQLDTMEGRDMLNPAGRASVHRVGSSAEAIAIPRSCHEGLCSDLGKPPLQPR